ncbi:MAG: DUF4340 domain-containing protein [Lentimicrobiaceae bacterium]|nr:DUF4340 domain-containing protein [Lentimicrobiaceae bacterium]
MDYRILIVVLLVLVAVFIITKYVRKDERTFRNELVSFMPDDISGILFTPDPAAKQQVRLQRQPEGDWKIYSGEKAYNADSAMIHGLLRSINHLKPIRVAAMSEAKWKDYQVDDSTGIRVRLLKNEEEVADLVIGKFSYKPAEGQESMYGRGQGQMTSYVRLPGEKEVYAVDGYLRMGFQSNINSLRDKALVRAKREDISRVTFTQPGTLSFTLERQGEGFTVNGILADSAESAGYISLISRISSQDFLNDQPLGPASGYAVKIEGNNMVPIEIVAHTADTINKYILTSSVNPGTLFSGYGKNKLFEKIFVPVEKFAKKEMVAPGS